MTQTKRSYPSGREVLDTYTLAIFRDTWRYVAMSGDAWRSGAGSRVTGGHQYMYVNCFGGSWGDMTMMAAYHDLRDHGHVHLALCQHGSESPAESSTDHQT